MITIDGSEGEGGGQVLRNSVALSLITGQPCRITNIRGKREKPGLMRQHMTAIEAACRIGNATCDGLDMRSSEITFTPGSISAGDYHFAVGTAGSTGLVLQTVLMPLILADAPSRLVLEGGTHAMAAPPFDFIERCFLPIINRMGPTVTARLVRHGFYPRGGGRIEIEITPAPLQRIDCLDRGAQTHAHASALIAGIPHEVAERELETARKILGWGEEHFVTRQLPEGHGPGNVLLIEAGFDHVTEIVSGFGKLGVSSESVAKTAAQRMAGYLESSAFAGPYLADQMLLPFALAGGGSFTTVKPSQHSRTAADIIERFTGRRFVFGQQPGGEHLVQLLA
jgi:RNA 3'-terminal phosphate cyclase (ATP)